MSRSGSRATRLEGCRAWGFRTQVPKVSEVTLDFVLMIQAGAVFVVSLPVKSWMHGAIRLSSRWMNWPASNSASRKPWHRSHNARVDRSVCRQQSLQTSVALGTHFNFLGSMLADATSCLLVLIGC